ncbi:MAG: hypothetical protein DRN49_04335 [Thaumarchaeota archaeon]|nr:MAG: hypothetical protein DRN49_04335 [Nitrososphaerota archaeon]
MAALVPIGGWRFVSKLLMIFTALAVFLEFPFLLVYSLIFASATMLAFLFQVAIYIYFWYLLFVSVAYRSMENYLLPLKSYSFIND